MGKITKAFLFIFLVGGISAIFIYQNHLKNEREKEIISQNNLIKEIKSHYSQDVKTNKQTKIYNFDGHDYQEIGLIGKNVELTLKKLNITNKTQYFCSTINFCLSYKDVDKIDRLSEIDNDRQFKKYVVFNENIVTKDKTIFYNENGLEYQLNESMSLPILIKDDHKYYVEYNNKLLFLKKEEIDRIVENQNSVEKTKKKVRTLTYHFVYNPEVEKCNQSICHTVEQFESHMKYLSENDYLTLTMKDLELFLANKIQIPEKSIVITIDDGWNFELATKIIEKYKVYANYFIVTSWYDPISIKSQYMDFQSHTHNMHNNWKCPGGNQGGEILCAKKEAILEDLKQSQQQLNGSYVFAYPFFDFNERAIEILKEAGFRLAFIGQYDTDGFSDSSTNKMMLRRKTIFSNLSLAEFKEYVK